MPINSCLDCARRVEGQRRFDAVMRLSRKLADPAAYPHVFRLLEQLPLCGRCLEELPFLDGRLCEGCGRSMSEDMPHTLCGDCRRLETDHLVCNRSVLRYEGWAKERMERFKYRGDERWARCLGGLLAISYQLHYRSCAIGRITAVPLHPTRLRERGFNQAELLASELGKQIGLPLVSLLQRSKQTDKLSKQRGRESRKRSVQDAFTAISGAVRGEEGPGVLRRWFGIRRNGTTGSILLIDDIYTTGSTVRACATALRSEYQEMPIFSLTLCR